jgi:UMP-CMP kinase
MSSTPLYTSDKPVFDKEKILVCFVLGGPGAGKGTQCDLMVRDYGFKHLSAGDLLREEQDRPGSKYGDLIRGCIKEGLIVPLEVTIKLIENAMAATLANPPAGEGWANGKGRFLIDGFPRKMDQALMFDKAVVDSSLVLFINTTEEVMRDRIKERSKTSGRADDNEESLKKRFVTYRETSYPVIEYYIEQGKCVDINSTPAVEEVYSQIKETLKERLPNL